MEPIYFIKHQQWVKMYHSHVWVPRLAPEDSSSVLYPLELLTTSPKRWWYGMRSTVLETLSLEVTKELCPCLYTFRCQQHHQEALLVFYEINRLHDLVFGFSFLSWRGSEGDCKGVGHIAKPIKVLIDPFNT